MNWDNAKKWEECANQKDDDFYDSPIWKFDCGFKLDYDGSILKVDSRFYPNGNNNNTYDGSVTFNIKDETVFRREFSSRHIDILKKDVEQYIDSVFSNIVKLLNKNIGVFVAREEE